MTKLNQTVCIRYWQVLALMGGTGFAVGNVLAKTVAALGG